MRILLIDDHALVREGLKLILAEQFPSAAFGEARNAHEALLQVEQADWALVILDVTLPGRSGVEVLREIKRLRPEVPVLVLSMHPEDQLAVRMLKAGAAGYLSKSSAGEELVAASRKVLAGGRHISPQLAERMASYLGIDVRQAPHERLSSREFLVLRLIAGGKTVGQIAQELSLSVNTVATYRRRVLKKMDMKTNAQLTHYAVRRRLVE